MRSLVIAILLVAACGKNNEPPAPTSGAPNAQPESGPSHGRAGGAAPGSAQPSQAQQMFDLLCATCHGADGKGTGPAASALTPKPRDYTDPAWQASVTDDQLKETILKGGAGVGKSPSMPGQPQLEGHPEVLNDLVKIIRGFGKR